MDLTQTQLQVNNGVATVTLRRPEQLNAVTPIMAKELVEIFAEADRNDAIRVVVVTGAGKAYCAGADLSAGPSTWDMSKQAGKHVAISEHRDRAGKVSLAIFNCRKPVIAAIHKTSCRPRKIRPAFSSVP